MVGLMKTTDTVFPFVFVLLLNSHFNTGTLESSGVPEPDSLFSSRSIPPTTIISSFFTLMVELNSFVDFGGGSFTRNGPMKSEMPMVMFSVTCSSPDTNGFTRTNKLASTGMNSRVMVRMGVRPPPMFSVSFT